MQKLQRHSTDQGLVWLSIISSAPGKQGHVTAREAHQEKTRHRSQATAILLDSTGKVGKLYDARVTPQLFVIGPQGKIKYLGGIDSIPSTDPKDIARATPYLADALDALAQGKAIKQAKTRPYGCSVKY